MPAKKKTKIGQTHMARIEMPGVLWQWILEQADAQTRGNATAYVIKTLDEVRRGDMVPRSVLDNQIRESKIEIKAAKELFTETLARGFREAGRAAE